MAGSPWTYLSYDLVPMTTISALPFSGVTFGQVVNQPGAWQGSLQLSDPRVQALDWQDATRTGRTALFVDLAGALVWGGIIWTQRYKEQSKVMVVGAVEFGSYFAQRLQAKDYTTNPAGGAYWTATPADPMAIVQQLVYDAQQGAITFPGVSCGQIGGNGANGTQNGVTIVVNGATPSGKWITATYPKTQLQTIDSITQTLSQMGYTFGFDYSYNVAYLPGTEIPAVVLNLWYPRQGRLAEQSQILINQRQIVDFTYDVDSTSQGIGIAETSSGSGGLVPAYFQAPSLLASGSPIGTVPGYPPLERLIPRTQINDIAHLTQCARGDIDLYANPVVTPMITVPVAMPVPTGQTDPTQLGFNDFTLGDDLIWVCDPYDAATPTLNMSPRFPNGMRFEWRINAWNCTVADKGLSTFTFTLGLPPTTVQPPPTPPT